MSGWAGGLLGGGDDVEHQLQVRCAAGADVGAVGYCAGDGADVPSGYGDGAGSWQLSTFAVCGPRKGGIVAASQVAAGPTVSVSCPAGMQIHGAGGGLGLTDGGTNWIRTLRPANTLPGSMTVRMSLTNPDSVVAHTTCATRT